MDPIALLALLVSVIGIGIAGSLAYVGFQPEQAQRWRDLVNAFTFKLVIVIDAFSSTFFVLAFIFEKNLPTRGDIAYFALHAINLSYLLLIYMLFKTVPAAQERKRQIEELQKRLDAVEASNAQEPELVGNVGDKSVLIK